MTKLCDHYSVGVVVTNPSADSLLMLRRAKHPIGIAPVAGHIDDHGSPHSAALAELEEEVGLTARDLATGWSLEYVTTEKRGNICRRPPTHPTHDGHLWTIYTCAVDPERVKIVPSLDETQGARWYSARQIQDLAEWTGIYALNRAEDGPIDYEDKLWRENPGIEPVWIRWLVRLGYVTGLSDREMIAISMLAREQPEGT